MRIWIDKDCNAVCFQPDSDKELKTLDAWLGHPFPGRSVAICDRKLSGDPFKAVGARVPAAGKITGHETQRTIWIGNVGN